MQEKPCLPNWYNNSSHTYMQTHSDKYVSESMLGSKVFFPYNLHIVAQVIGFEFTCEAHVRVRFLVTKFVLIHCSNGRGKEKSLRVEEMLEEPSAQNGDGAFGKASLRPPWGLLHHPLLKRLLLPYALVEQLEPRRLAPRHPRRGRILLPHCLLGCADLTYYPIPQTPKVPRHGPICQRRIHSRCFFPSHSLERRCYSPHLLAVFSVSLVYLN